MNGILLIAEERKRQQEQEGWTPEHDDEHVNCEMANAAATYAMDPEVRAGLTVMINGCLKDNVPPTWPWDPVWWKPSPDNRIKELAKAGALIAAEIDRLLRAEKK